MSTYTAVASFLRAGEACESLGHDKQNKLRGRKEEREKETLALGPRVAKLTYESMLIG